MNIKYTPPPKDNNFVGGNKCEGATISFAEPFDDKSEYYLSKMSHQIEDENMVKSLGIKRFWSVFFSLLFVSLVTAWVYVTKNGGSLEFQPFLAGTLMTTLPASLIHTNYYVRKLLR